MSGKGEPESILMGTLTGEPDGRLAGKGERGVLTRDRGKNDTERAARPRLGKTKGKMRRLWHRGRWHRKFSRQRESNLSESGSISGKRPRVVDEGDCPGMLVRLTSCRHDW